MDGNKRFTATTAIKNKKQKTKNKKQKTIFHEKSIKIFEHLVGKIQKNKKAKNKNKKATTAEKLKKWN